MSCESFSVICCFAGDVCCSITLRHSADVTPPSCVPSRMHPGFDQNVPVIPMEVARGIRERVMEGDNEILVLVEGSSEASKHADHCFILKFRIDIDFSDRLTFGGSLFFAPNKSFRNFFATPFGVRTGRLDPKYHSVPNVDPRPRKGVVTSNAIF